MLETKVTVTIENLAPENETALTPLWFGLHDGNFDTYDRGRPASAGLENINDEAESSTAFFGQTAPNAGEIEAGVIESHSGFEPEDRILSSSDFANADFTAEDDVKTVLLSILLSMSNQQ